MKIYLIFLIPLALWIISCFWLHKWDSFWPFLIINIIVIVLYEVYFVSGDVAPFRSNQYGFERLLLFIFVPTVHALLVFIFAFFMKGYLKK